MSDSDVETPPMKSRKVSMANHATVARRSKSDTKKQRASYARKTRHSNDHNDSLAQARQAKLNKQQSTPKPRKSKRNGNNNYQGVSNVVTDLKTLLDQLNVKLQEYAKLDDIQEKTMYVNIS